MRGQQLGTIISIAALMLACSSSNDSADASNDDAGIANDSTTEAANDSGPTPTEKAEFDQLLAFADNELTKGHTPGASIAIVLHGKLAFASGVGNRNTKGDPVTTSTLFRVASMSKMIVAATAMSLVDQSKLDLDAPITQYVPWFALQNGYDASTLTTSLLLSHSSGFPCDTIPQCDANSSGDRKSFFVANPQPLWAPPGATYDYSNTGFAVVSSILEAASGSTEGAYEQLAHDRVFVPAGMTTATFDANAAQSGDHATGYVLDGNGNVTASIEPTTIACPLLDPPGGILATATDYAHFAEMLLANGGTTLTSASAMLMQSPHANTHSFASQEYAYGLVHQFSPYPDHASVWHDGSLPGFLSEMWMIPDDGFAVIALVNARGNDSVADDIIGEALGLFITENRVVPPLTTPPSAWNNYLGTYDDALATLGAGVTVSLGDAGTSLVVNAPNSTPPVSGTMTQYAIDEWGMPDGTVVTFFPQEGADGGAAKYLVSRRGTAAR